MSDKLQRLELVWPGKNERVDVEPRILIEDAEKSYSADPKIQEKMNRQLFKQKPEIAPTFDNMLIHGDNLLALKALEAEYSGQIKCIYIDPPYNTGNAFEYYDDGYEHSIWLSLMRERLEILQNLLADDGSIWITLDDNETHYCKILCDEIFGRKNFIADVIWNSRKSISNDAIISLNTNHILVYAKQIDIIRTKAKKNELFKGEIDETKFDNPDNDPRGKWTATPFDAPEIRENLMYPIKNPNTGEIYLPPYGRHWRTTQDEYERYLKEGRIVFGKNGTSKPQLKRYLNEATDKGQVLTTLWNDVDTTTNATKHSQQLFGKNPFTNPKPENLIERVLTLASNPGDLVLDSFLGSGTTAAVAHKMGRRWIGIEMGDHIYSHCLPRLKKVIDCEDAGGITKSVKWQGGGGFKFYELGSTLIVTDKHGRQVISDKYNPEMLAEAMCKLMGYKYAPDKETYWKQGYSSEKNFIFTTTMNVEEQLLAEMSQALGDGNLLICCGAFTGNKTAYDNITIKKIPQAILKKCQWGSAGYPLPVREDFSDEDFEFEDEE